MHELVLRADENLVEPVSDVLMNELDALSVSVEDADIDTAVEQPLFGEPGMPAPRAAWAHSTVRALFADETQATAAATLLLAQIWAAEVHVQALQAVPDTDWVRLTQAQFAPVQITPSFWVVPSWHEAPAAAAKVIRLDPGLAFGTILAIAAGLHGAAQIDAVDIDMAAVEAARANALANSVTLNAATPDAAQGRYDLVLANILAKPLTLLAPLLSTHVASGGYLVLAGILERQVDELRAAYGPWLLLEVQDCEDGWVLMAGQSDTANGRGTP
jgi:ribosomal protein L11 methyltransferase